MKLWIWKIIPPMLSHPWWCKEWETSMKWHNIVCSWILTCMVHGIFWLVCSFLMNTGLQHIHSPRMSLKERDVQTILDVTFNSSMWFIVQGALSYIVFFVHVSFSYESYTLLIIDPYANAGRETIFVTFLLLILSQVFGWWHHSLFVDVVLVEPWVAYLIFLLLHFAYLKLGED